MSGLSGKLVVGRKRGSSIKDKQNDGQIKAHRVTLRKLMSDPMRVITPRTGAYINGILENCNKALQEVEKSQTFFDLKSNISVSMNYLEKSLKSDVKYEEVLAKLQLLEERNTILTYGDYYAASCADFKRIAKQIDSKGGDLLNKLWWADILEKLTKEAKTLNTWYETKSGPMPDQSTTTLLEGVAQTCKYFNYKMMLSTIEAYVKRNGIAYNGLNGLVKARKWHDLAVKVTLDEMAVKNVYTEGKADDDEKIATLTTVIKNFANRYFKVLEGEYDDLGNWCVNYILTREVYEEDIRLLEDMEKVSFKIPYKEGQILNESSYSGRQMKAEAITPEQKSALRFLKKNVRSLEKQETALKKKKKEEEKLAKERHQERVKELAQIEKRLEEARSHYNKELNKL